PQTERAAAEKRRRQRRARVEDDAHEETKGYAMAGAGLVAVGQRNRCAVTQNQRHEEPDEVRDWTVRVHLTGRHASLCQKRHCLVLKKDAEPQIAPNKEDDRTDDSCEVIDAFRWHVALLSRTRETRRPRKQRELTRAKNGLAAVSVAGGSMPFQLDASAAATVPYFQR